MAQKRGSADLLIVNGLKFAQRRFDNRSLFRHMQLGQTSGGRSGGAATDVSNDGIALNAFTITARCDHTRLDVVPSSHVLWLFLDPHDTAGLDTVTMVHVLVFYQLLQNLVKGEGGQLFQAHDGDVVQTETIALGGQLVVDFTGAENKPVNVLGCDCRIALRDDSQKFSVAGELLDIRNAILMSQQILRRHDDQRFSELAQALLTERVEVVCGCGDVVNLPIRVLDLLQLSVGNVILIVISHLQKSFHSARRMLRSLAIISVGQEHHETSLLEPLMLTGGNVLVEHYLSGVRKITKLCLPQVELEGGLVRISKLE